MRTFVYEPRYTEVYFEQGDSFAVEGWDGFGARIQSNPTGAERHHAQRLWRAAIDEKTTEAEQAFWDYVAPRIVEWNLEKRQPDGSTQTYPAPAEDAGIIMREIEDPRLRIWLALAVQTAHQPEGLGQLLEAIKASPSAASTTASTPPVKLRPKNSQKPSVSTLRA